MDISSKNRVTMHREIPARSHRGRVQFPFPNLKSQIPMPPSLNPCQVYRGDVANQPVRPEGLENDIVELHSRIDEMSQVLDDLNQRCVSLVVPLDRPSGLPETKGSIIRLSPVRERLRGACNKVENMITIGRMLLDTLQL